MKNLLSAWFGLAIYEFLSLTPDEKRRMWFIVDEIDALGRINGLRDALARLRKFGGRVVLGFQSISQLRLVYGDAEANTIIENCGNKLILRCESSERGGSADFAVRLIGDRLVKWNQYSVNTGIDADGGSVSTQEKRETAVMASEIMQLPNLSGFFRFAGARQWLRVSFKPTSFKQISK